ncbi:hypothetical protein L1887_40684 [Cichorium endivia]|nr:hypothetical protein L1887_40684 [Cichorium endivia]
MTSNTSSDELTSYRTCKSRENEREGLTKNLKIDNKVRELEMSDSMVKQRWGSVVVKQHQLPWQVVDGSSTLGSITHFPANRLQDVGGGDDEIFEGFEDGYKGSSFE